ncbi:Stp1/IreP family PP2C-type Ser/Thr phosphatase [Salisediminibacterium selenitireducens]|uniref:Protein serine/threonine phosphatase n=1 Tax=Bacillus selenitireducens (strain ATCC 700615 / DSM 15326 / MLS10) TaxID=439292 RepID=D6XTR6_BACIE|nr:Stp1/IreP family PP2C-type Ser/Thr phosphatase [Salisediminibacterium selenitireducens]ADH99202.1 protein serine/threonine phosphatase [[Bacillus] selenitireducens MLS10]
MNGLFLTDIGKVRRYNEDAGAFFFHDRVEDTALAIAADGMGGHQAGDVASRMSVDLLSEFWAEAGEEEAKDWGGWLEANLAKVNTGVYTHGQSHPELQGMGTTVAAVICTESKFFVGNIGDSRVYHLNSSTGEFKQVTKDHSVAAELFRAGQISETEADHHPRKHMLTKAVGTNPSVASDVFEFGWTKGDKLLICTDGLSNKVSDESLARIMIGHTLLASAGQAMIGEANHMGGEDNISLILVEHGHKGGGISAS